MLATLSFGASNNIALMRANSKLPLEVVVADLDIGRVKLKKIVIACNHFAPDNTIAAVRITKFAKYLYQQGYAVTVIAEMKYDDIEDEILKRDAEGIHIIRVDNSKVIKRLIHTYKKLMFPIKSKRYDNLDDRMRINPKTGKYEFYPFETAYPIIGSLDYLVELLRQYDLYKMSKKRLCQYRDTDYIFSSYGDFFGFFIGRHLHKINKNVPWIFDIRDAICRYKFTPQCVRWIAKLYENYVWREADCITAVSKGICSHVPKKYWRKVHCVTNGYDKNDRIGISPNKKKSELLRFVYTGAMYGGIRNLSPFFENIERLIKEQNINEYKIEFCFAGKESAYQIFWSQAQKYGLGKFCVYYGRITRKEALKLQMEADVLLVSSFDYQTDVGGVITGKVLEYMSAGKPIIAIINGDIVHSELAEIIRNANLGIAYEESHHEVDNEKLYQYMMAMCKQFEINGKLTYAPNKELLKKYDYKYLCKRFLKIIETLY